MTATPMPARTLRLCAWCGPAALLLMCAGLLIAGVLPSPLGPSDSTRTVVRFYSAHPDRVALGLGLAAVGAGLVLPLCGAVSAHLLRIGRGSPVLALTQLAAGAVTVILLVVPLLMMAAIAFRPDRDPQLTVTLNDLSWLLFLTPVGPFVVQDVVVGLAVLGDRSPRPEFPRWVGYLDLVVAMALVPGVFALTCHSGPFAWNGVLVFWLALAAYGAWLLTMAFACLRAVRAAVGAEAVGSELSLTA